MQQVNLYTEEFQPRKVKLPLEQIILLGVATLVVLILVSVYLNHALTTMQTDIAERKQKAETMRQRVEAMEAKAATLVRDESLALANERLTQQLNARKDMIEVLDKVVVKDDIGYSSTLVALARQRVDGLWLTRISLGPAGRNMALEGETRSAEAVPQYLQNLRQEPSFVGRTFTLFDLKNDDAKGGAMQFRLKSLSDPGQASLLVSADAEGIDPVGEVQP